MGSKSPREEWPERIERYEPRGYDGFIELQFPQPALREQVPIKIMPHFKLTRWERVAGVGDLLLMDSYEMLNSRNPFAPSSKFQHTEQANRMSPNGS
jgi:hypothetical protein